tara:strand:- start:76 stop:336 length:261 start_codon:yes stop_codon:yes gene_type:complete
MFGANEISNVVENAINSNNTVDLQQANKSKVSLISLIVALLIILVINILLGPWLWNNVLKRLVPAVGKARWYDTVLLSVLLGLLFR